ncbi:MAG TPA: HAMP domain-containing sensor histidine kinase [Caulobacteraceae bacterium]|nr:HAMP domain-containing sensor histidine kinase [Caulobacteraceae bacterium]
MKRPRRGLFWQVYPTLLASLVLLAVLGAVTWRLFAGAMGMGGGAGSGAPAGRMHMHLLGMLLMVAAVVGVAAYPVVSRLTRRLEALRLSVEAWGGGQLDRRARVEGSDEIAAVAASFNAAADRTDALLAAHKALLAHASHELRSPLTRLALAAEMLASRAEPDLAASVSREIAELDALVEEILLASRLDHGGDLGEGERVDLLALAAEEAARASVHMREVPPDSVAFDVIGAPRLLRRLIRNLIENALQHGAPPIEVALARKIVGGESFVVVMVSDHGRGVPAALRTRVFEPFYRPEGWSEEGGGWGLGLSLVRQIAERHRGRASCEAGEDGATRFAVELPGAKR